MKHIELNDELDRLLLHAKELNRRLDIVLEQVITASTKVIKIYESQRKNGVEKKDIGE